MAGKKAKKPKSHVTEALHLKDGDNHIVGLKALRVLLTPDGAGWFAQGLEIDYAASGATLDEVKDNFAEGLACTVGEHLKMYGNIEKVLKVAPQEAWLEYLRAPEDAIKTQLSQVAAFLKLQKAVELQAASDAFPFSGIAYVKAAAKQKATAKAEAA